MNICFASLLCLTLTMGGYQEPDSQVLGSTSQTSGHIDFDKCFVQIISDIDLPALESGKLTEIMVKPGQLVETNTLVAQMDDKRSQRALEEATLRHEIANERANDETEINTAYKRYNLAFLEHKKIQTLRQSGSMSEQQADRSRVSAEIAELEYYAAKKAKKLAGIEAAAEMVNVQASNDSIERHELRSPISGVVYEVKKDAGEWVTAGETVMKIAQMDRLRIPGIVNGNEIDPDQLEHKKVTATATLAGGKEVTFKGEIVNVAIKKQQGNKFLVWAEVDNRLVNNGNSKRWLLLPGSKVRMRIHLGQSTVKSASAFRTGSNRLNK